MFPGAFIRRLSLQPYLDPESLLEALALPSPVSVRINRAKWEGIPELGEKIPWSSSGYWLRSRPSFTIDPLFHAGCYYPQEASGMFLEQIVHQLLPERNNIKILDLCGAPGGKSTILSDLAGEESLVVCNEVIRSRAHILAETLTKWGSSNTLVTQSDPSAFGNLQGFFDLVLVDAPCSGEGMFRTEVAIGEWSEENAQLCCERQRRILMDVWPSLREGGILVYSTCTFNPAENEEIVEWLVGLRYAESLRIGLNSFEGITEISRSGIYGYGFYPDRIRGEGLFMAAVRKRDRPFASSKPKDRDNDLKATASEVKQAMEWSGFDPRCIVRIGHDIIALPCTGHEYNTLKRSLRIIRPGTGIATVKNNDIIPSHELAMSVTFRAESFPSFNADIDMARMYLRRDLPACGCSTGWNVMKYNNIPLGFVKNIGSRINNYYPMDWRIRMDQSNMPGLEMIRWSGDTAATASRS